MFFYKSQKSTIYLSILFLLGDMSSVLKMSRALFPSLRIWEASSFRHRHFQAIAMSTSTSSLKWSESTRSSGHWSLSNSAVVVGSGSGSGLGLHGPSIQFQSTRYIRSMPRRSLEDALTSAHDFGGSAGAITLTAEEAKGNFKHSSFGVTVAVGLALCLGNFVLMGYTKSLNEKVVLIREEDLVKMANDNPFPPFDRLAENIQKDLAEFVLRFEKDPKGAWRCVEWFLVPFFIHLFLNVLRLCKQNEDLRNALGEPMALCMKEKCDSLGNLRFQIMGPLGEGSGLLEIERTEEGDSCFIVEIDVSDLPETIRIPIVRLAEAAVGDVLDRRIKLILWFLALLLISA